MTVPFESAWKTFDRETLGPDRPELGKADEVNVSAHFLVDRDGTIYRLMPETRLARHVIGLNWCAIGIENVGGPESPLTAVARGTGVFLEKLEVFSHILSSEEDDS